MSNLWSSLHEADAAVMWGARQRFVMDPPRWDALMEFNSHLVMKILSEMVKPPTNTQYSGKHWIAKGFRQWAKVAFLCLLHQPAHWKHHRATLKGYNHNFLEEYQVSLAANVMRYRHTHKQQYWITVDTWWRTAHVRHNFARYAYAFNNHTWFMIQ